MVHGDQNQRRRRSESGSIGSLVVTDEDDWTKLSDSKERRKIQNRLAQRQYRRFLFTVEGIESLLMLFEGKPGKPESKRALNLVPYPRIRQN
jgi:hypothetical protein